MTCDDGDSLTRDVVARVECVASSESHPRHSVVDLHYLLSGSVKKLTTQIVHKYVRPSRNDAIGIISRPSILLVGRCRSDVTTNSRHGGSREVIDELSECVHDRSKTLRRT